MTFETLSEVVNEIQAMIVREKVVLSDPIDFYDRMSEPVNYGAQHRYSGPQSGEIETRKGKKTNARVQVIIERFGLQDGARMGRYELIAYVG